MNQRWPILSSPFVHADTSVRKTMFHVQLASIPALFIYFYFFGYGITIQWTLGVLTAIIVEAAMLYLRNRPILPYLTDFSALITVTGITFSIPPDAPWWLMVTGVSFALIFGKHLYGGLGYNPFNPAMMGFAFLIVSFPAQMTLWTTPIDVSGHKPSFLQSLDLIFFGHSQGVTLDQITGATPLGEIKTNLTQHIPVTESLKSQLFSNSQVGIGWVWVNIAFILGGIYLLLTRAIRWQFPIGFLAGLTLMALIFHAIDPQTYAPLSVHLLSGGTMLAAFFIITDPVSGPTTPRGRLFFAFSIGVLLYIIRNWGAFPDGIAFAILIMNMFVPLIDQYTQPRVFGYQREKV
ncbi:electron transport complex subunit RsxD [Galenea microaerophila]